MRNRILLAVALVLVMALPAQADPADCNAIVSMSQGKQVYDGSRLAPPFGTQSELETLTGEQWMLLFSPSKTLPWWAVASNWDTLSERDRCGVDTDIDHVLFVFDPFGSTDMAADLTSVLAITASRYPNAEVALSLLVGSVGHVVCQINGQNVRASVVHADRIDEMTMPEAGPDLDVPCSSYADKLGHLNDAGAVDAQTQVAAWFNVPSLPETIPHPPISFANGYTISVNASNPQRLLWSAPYLYDVPYADDAGWLPGDRVGYGCAYGFLGYRGELVGRFTFLVMAQSASYIVVNDKYMVEGGRFYDGSLTPPGTVQVPSSECPPRPTGYAPSDADERPLVVFWSGDTALELRDYRGVNVGPGVAFEVVDAPEGHDVAVLARENGVPVLVVYYDALGSGRISSHS